MVQENNVQSVVIIGGGLVGSLAASFMAKQGYHVQIFESRPDMRQTKSAQGRSINLALSNRGRRALNAIGLEDSVLQAAIPMKGRLLHGLKGETKSVPYDSNTQQCIYSVGRNFLNCQLLTAAENQSNVQINFNHKLTHANFNEGSVTILNTITNESKPVVADLILGCDGAFSRLRRCMQQTARFEFSQNYIEHGYVELAIPAERGAAMAANHLHIWPRGEFMMIALPNRDKSWTVTLFMPFANFKALRSAAQIVQFFTATFPDAVALIGADRIVDRLMSTEPSALMSVKCNPYQVGGRFLLIGDAAHAIVPFYGQGMNAGFEDCFIFDRILTENGGEFALGVREFSERRRDDAFAISDLAMYNYVEMRDLVTRRTYRLRKFVDDFLFGCFPNEWIPLYNSVTFSAIGYKQCVDNRSWQDEIIRRVGITAAFTASVLTAYVGFLWFK